MRYVIYGAGGIGCIIGAQLSLTGHDVTLIARGGQLAALRADGLTLESPDEARTLRLDAVERPSQTSIAPEDVVILAMKSQDTEAALRELQLVAPTETPIVCAQNGVENERMAARRFANVYAMVVLVGAFFVRPGVVQNYSTPTKGILDLGRYPAGTSAVGHTIRRDLERAGFSSELFPDIMRWKYGKLLGNLRTGVDAICPPGAEANALIDSLREEAEGVLRAADIEWASDAEQQQRRGDRLAGGTIAGQGRTGTSSWQSLARRTGSMESDWFNGEIAMLGRLHGMATPLNTAVQDLSNRAAAEGREPGSISVATVLGVALRTPVATGDPAVGS